jgi:hypothetical protein
VVAMMWYSAGVWKMIDEYFKNQFVNHLQIESETNEQLREDMFTKGELFKSTNIKVSKQEINIEEGKMELSSKYLPEYVLTNEVLEEKGFCRLENKEYKCMLT